MSKTLKVQERRKTILERIELLEKEVEAIKKQLYFLETNAEWAGSFLKELLEVVGLQ